MRALPNLHRASVGGRTVTQPSGYTSDKSWCAIARLPQASCCGQSSSMNRTVRECSEELFSISRTERSKVRKPQLKTTSRQTRSSLGGLGSKKVHPAVSSETGHGTVSLRSVRLRAGPIAVQAVESNRRLAARTARSLKLLSIPWPRRAGAETPSLCSTSHAKGAQCFSFFMFTVWRERASWTSSEKHVRRLRQQCWESCAIVLPQ